MSHEVAAEIARLDDQLAFASDHCLSDFGFRVKAMYDTLKTRKELDEAGPSMPVTVTGLDVAPNAGDHFYVVDDVAKARDRAARVGAHDDVRELVRRLEAALRLDVQLLRGAGIERRLADGAGGDLDVLLAERIDDLAGG